LRQKACTESDGVVQDSCKFCCCAKYSDLFVLLMSFMTNMSDVHNFDLEQMYSFYANMLLLRRFEEKAGQLYGLGLIGGFCHLYIGQEAVAIGIKANLAQGDDVITSYRDHGMMLAMGSDPKIVMAELTGRVTGCSRGKGGSMHMFDPEKGFWGGHGIVGAQVPIGTGLAFASKYLKKNSICVTLLGDGAANQGQVYESFNMASLWNLPVIYIVENNEYAMGTSTARSSSSVDFYKRGEPFGICGKQVDGMDFFAVYDAMREAVMHVRETGAPLLLEMKTYRYRGHSMSDPGRYRSKEEIEQYREYRDPIQMLRKSIENIGDDSNLRFTEIEKKIKTLIEEATKFAQESPEPEVSELYTDIYAQ
jgi:pyruvate dehydrogenase E1 component alpha subunit